MSITSNATSAPDGGIAHEVAAVRAVKGLARDHGVTFAVLLVDLGAEVGEGGEQHPEQREHTVTVGAQRTERRVVDEVVGQKIFGNRHVVTGLVLLDEAAHHGLVGV
jgi:hypothetical protein